MPIKKKQPAKPGSSTSAAAPLPQQSRSVRIAAKAPEATTPKPIIFAALKTSPSAASASSAATAVSTVTRKRANSSSAASSKPDPATQEPEAKRAEPDYAQAMLLFGLRSAAQGFVQNFGLIPQSLQSISAARTHLTQKPELGLDLPTFQFSHTEKLNYGSVTTLTVTQHEIYSSIFRPVGTLFLFIQEPFTSIAAGTVRSYMDERINAQLKAAGIDCIAVVAPCASEPLTAWLFNELNIAGVRDQLISELPEQSINGLQVKSDAPVFVAINDQSLAFANYLGLIVERRGLVPKTAAIYFKHGKLTQGFFATGPNLTDLDPLHAHKVIATLKQTPKPPPGPSISL